MAINMFEGARRIAQVIAGLIVVTVAVGCYDQIRWSSRQTIALRYPFQIVSEGATPVRVTACPPGVKEVKNIAITTSDDIEVKADFCLVYWGPWKDYDALAKKYGGATIFDPYDYVKNGEELEFRRRYAQEQAAGRERGRSGGAFDDLVPSLIDAKSIKFSATDEEMIRDLRRGEIFKILREYFFNALMGLAAFWAFTWATGWIVRGFVGIPRGMDRKP